MTDPRPLTPVGEAQLLLTRHEPWSTETGAYLESDDVLILIEATEAEPPEVEPFRRVPVGGPDAVEASGFGAATLAGATTALVDVLITVRSRRRPGELRDLPIELVGPDGRTVTGRIGPRGQARFAGLPAGRWRTRLLPAATTGTDAETDSVTGFGAAGGAVVVPFRRISRVLADAAARGTRHLREVLTSADAEVTTEVEETDEGRFVATVTTARPTGLVRLRWRLVPAEGAEATAAGAAAAGAAAAATSEVRTLVTPLAERPEGGGVAKYDLGPVVEAVAVDLAPAEWAAAGDLDADGVRAAFDLVLYGSAVRAWEGFAASDACPAALRPLIAEALAQQ
jgi:hypothetical protein